MKRAALPERADAADETGIVELEHVNAVERHTVGRERSGAMPLGRAPVFSANHLLCHALRRAVRWNRSLAVQVPDPEFPGQLPHIVGMSGVACLQRLPGKQFARATHLATLSQD